VGSFKQSVTLIATISILFGIFVLINFQIRYIMSAINNKLGERIAELRKEKDLSQQDLADKVKISRAQMNRYENQAVQPPADVLNKLSKVLDTTVDYIINGAIEAKAKAALKDNKILEQYKELEHMPEPEKLMIVKVINALIRDFKTRQSYNIA
jgi:transcriptional regulator with XRE-family HTH domain